MLCAHLHLHLRKTYGARWKESLSTFRTCNWHAKTRRVCRPVLNYRPSYSALHWEPVYRPRPVNPWLLRDTSKCIRHYSWEEISKSHHGQNYGGESGDRNNSVAGIYCSGITLHRYRGEHDFVQIASHYNSPVAAQQDGCDLRPPGEDAGKLYLHW